LEGPEITGVEAESEEPSRSPEIAVKVEEERHEEVEEERHEERGEEHSLKESEIIVIENL